MKIGFIHLGCSKNLIDTEMAIGLFLKNGHTIVNNIEQAEMIVINTCGFIESAKQEAIDTILETTEYKRKGSCKYIVVMGCLVQRYYNELKKAIPEVDLFIQINDYDKFWEKIGEITPTVKKVMQLEYSNRIVSTGKTTAYLKIAEGCSNRCTYCAIPNIRGPFVSRKMEDIIGEAKNLAKQGYKEIILIAQDTTKYGIDIYGEAKLPELLNELCKIKEFKWIRVLYSYPESITKELIATMKNNDKICKYFDIPIQHISDKILKRMNRKTTRKNIMEKIEEIRTKIPEAVLRTSLIVGFPGETEEQFNELYDFVKTIKFDKLGVFKYSKEDGTPAAKLPDQIHYKTKQKRYNKMMQLAKQISKENLKKHLGKEYEVLIENKTNNKKYYIGRTYMDVPDTDGVVLIKNSKENLLDEWKICKITDTYEYDLIGKII